MRCRRLSTALAWVTMKRVVSVWLALMMFGAVTPACGVVRGCTSIATDTVSVARLWNEATLDAIRRDFPAPTVHARNLWHLSAVMWDAWSAFTPGTEQYFSTPRPRAQHGDRLESIDQAISFAAHGLLTERYAFAIGGAESIFQFDDLMQDLCLDPVVEAESGSPAEIGRAIAQSAIEFGADDGASEITRYIDLSYQPVNEPLLVASGEIDMVDPNRWQPLQLSERVTQNGQALGPGTQVFIGSQWGSVTSFALPAADERGITLDPGPPPLLGGPTDAEFKQAVLELIAYSDSLGGAAGAQVIDQSPGQMGNHSVGANDGAGHPANPMTGAPYAANPMLAGDYGRAIAEFWADGPDSETPPGHWNTLAIAATDAMDPDQLQWQGQGDTLTRLEWDLRLFFAVNGALHDAAIATWGAKREYDYARPISMVRYLGSRGELPLVDGLFELVTAETTAPGGRHEGLTVGATAVRSWLGPPDDVETQTAGVGWLEASDWLPYQRPTFVSPAFAAYVSGHSAFSRAAADVLSEATGSEFFPGGLFTHTVEAGSLKHEDGPTVDVELQWATYGDAADEAGESRRYGGIHVAADDFAGRVLGAQVADLAWERAQPYFGT